MIRRQLVLCSTLSILAFTQLLAQPAVVNIQLRPKPEGPRVIEVVPNATAVCRNTPNCPTRLDFRWVGAAGSDPSERIVVEYKSGLFFNDAGEPARIAPAECFTFPGGANPFELEHGANREVVFRDDNPSCPDKAAFFYDISCRNQAADGCGGVETLDPGTMVDNGKP